MIVRICLNGCSGVDYFSDWNCSLVMRRTILSTLILLLTSLRGQEQHSEDFDIDNRAALVQVLRNSAKGKWQSHANKTLPFDEFKQKSGLHYLLYEDAPFSGWYGQWDDNGTLRNLRRFSNGKPDGGIFSWRKNGDKFHQGKYKEGKKHGIFTYWSKTLTCIREQNFKHGKLDGICTAWYENGNKSSIQTFISGKILNATGWKPNGERCPSTKVVNGVGVLVFYDEGHTENAQTLSRMEFIIERYDNGKKREEGSYLNGKKEGLWIYYRTDGTEFFRTTYESGREKRPSPTEKFNE
jgi:antitoxin component YwqK of YwqJK toxin-antitoxin module